MWSIKSACKTLGVSVCLTVGLAISATASADFKSPTGNIICSPNGSGVVCMIMNRSNAKPARPKPRNCDLDWGNVFYVSRSGAGLSCHGDIPVNPNTRTVLAYGKTYKGNGWQCTSRTTGMTCKNSQGRGFTLSRAKQTVF